MTYIDAYVKDAWEYVDSLGDKSVDLVLTDPMYKDAFYLEKLQRVCSGSIIVFCQPENVFFKPDEQAFWIKSPSTKNYSKHIGRFVEYILIKKGKTFNAGLHWSNYTGVYDDRIEGTKLHEFQKPLSLIERLMRIYSNEGDMVLDPFMGSGTTLLAAKNLNRGAIGMDIDPKCIELARSRL